MCIIGQFVRAEIDAVCQSMTVEHVQFVSCIKMTDLFEFRMDSESELTKGTVSRVSTRQQTAQRKQ